MTSKEKKMDTTLRQALRRIASVQPETRKYLLPLLHRHANCACGDEMIAGELDEIFAGRAYTFPAGPTEAQNKKKYGPPYTTEGLDKGKWDPEKKSKCYYETGDEADRCYVTTNGGPGGKTKADTGRAKNKEDYNKKYRKERWPNKYKNAQTKVAEVTPLEAAKYGGELAVALQRIIGGKANPGRVLGVVEHDEGKVSFVTNPAGRGREEIGIKALWYRGGKFPQQGFDPSRAASFWNGIVTPYDDPMKVAREIAKALEKQKKFWNMRASSSAELRAKRLQYLRSLRG